MTAPRTTSSYASLFGTNGAGAAGSTAQPTAGTRINNLFGQTRTPPTGPNALPTYQQTFAQMQAQGQARPAPPAAPTTGQYSQFQGSAQAGAARAPMLQSIQQQLAQPTRFDTNAFNQIRNAQRANLQSEFTEQQQSLNEDLARRGLSASTIGATGLGRLAGAQSRAMADIDANLLSQAAQTQAQDRLASLQAAGQFADLAGSQDLAQFEANRVGQAQQFQEALQAANFGQRQSEFDRQQAMEAANLEQTGGLSGLDLSLREQLGMGGLNLDAARFGQGRDEFDASLGEQRAGRLQQNTQFEQSLAEQLAGRLQQNTQFGRSMSLDEARAADQRTQFGSTLAETRAERELRQLLGQEGIAVDRERLAAQNDQFGRSLGETQSERELRQFLGEGDLDVRRSQAEAEQGMARNQMFMNLAQALSGMTPEQLRRLTAQTTPTPTTPPNNATSTGTNIPALPPFDQDALQRQLAEWFRNNPITFG